MISTGKKEFSAGRRIDLTAYIGPRRAGKRSFNGKYGENPRDEKEGYPSFITEEMFLLYKDAGMNFLMPEADAWYGQNITDNGYVKVTNFKESDLYHYMKMAEKCGLDVYPAEETIFGKMTHQDGTFGDDEKSIIRDFVTTVQQHCPNNFAGIMLTDEPGCDSLERVKKIVDYLQSEEIRAIKPNLKIFSSMLPMYAGISAFCPQYADNTAVQSERHDAIRTEAYQYYVEKCSEALGEFCYDYYSLGRDGWLSPMFYQNLELVAEHGKKVDIPIAITLLSLRLDANYNPKTGRGLNIYRAPSYEDMRFQVYSSLAFGVKKIGYFTFWQHFGESTGEVFLKAMVNYEPSEEKGYRVSEIYYAVKEVNQEILAFDHVFLRYKWQGCKVVRKSRDKNIRLVKGGYEKGCIVGLDASRDLLVGCFIHEEDETEGYWIVNAHNPYRYEVNDVEINFMEADHLLYYRKGKEYDIPLENGKLHIRLGVGEGIFAIPYKSTVGKEKNDE